MVRIEPRKRLGKSRILTFGKSVAKTGNKPKNYKSDAFCIPDTIIQGCVSGDEEPQVDSPKLEAIGLGGQACRGPF